MKTKGIAPEAEALEQQPRREFHFEEDVPETPPREYVSTLGDEILDFFVMDEDLKLEDLIPDDSVRTPEQEVEIRELRHCVNTARDQLPRKWRRALELHHIDGLRGAALAKALGQSKREVETILSHARAFLRQKLLEARCVTEWRRITGRLDGESPPPSRPSGLFAT